MANGKFWSLVHNGKLIASYPSLKHWVIKTGYGLAHDNNGYAMYTELNDAEKDAKRIARQYGGDVYIMEAIALATVPTAIVKIGG